MDTENLLEEENVAAEVFSPSDEVEKQFEQPTEVPAPIEVTDQAAEDAEIADEAENAKGGVLFIVSTPIGNDGDISMRALKCLQNSNLIVCEEGKVGGHFLHKYNLKQQMELLNENNEPEKTYEILKFLKDGKKISLVSDCGTPVLADPGLLLVQECIKNHIKIVPVPGATSIMSALVSSGFPINSFMFAGFMSREKTLRLKQIQELAKEPRTVVLLETPYRILPLLEAFVKVIPTRRAYIGCNLTFPFETHHYGTFAELYERFSQNRFKGEFVVVLEANFDSSTILVPEASSVEHDEKPWKSRGDRDRKFGDRDRKFGDRDRKFGDRDRKFGDRDRKFGDRDRKFGDRDRKFGERDRKFGDRDRKFGDKRGGGDYKKYGKRNDSRGGFKPRKDGNERRLPAE